MKLFQYTINKSKDFLISQKAPSLNQKIPVSCVSIGRQREIEIFGHIYLFIYLNIHGIIVFRTCH